MQRFIDSVKVAGITMVIGINRSDVEVRSEPLGAKCVRVQSSDLPHPTRPM